MENIIEYIKRLIEEIADIPQEDIAAESSLIDDLDLSSLEILSIISEVEKKYSFKVSESEMLSISTVEELAEIIDRKFGG